MEWLPIETAPKDGTRLILTFDFFGVYAGICDEYGMWCDGNWGLPDPTHWMPLPPPPKEIR